MVMAGLHHCLQRRNCINLTVMMCETRLKEGSKKVLQEIWKSSVHLLTLRTWNKLLENQLKKLTPLSVAGFELERGKGATNESHGIPASGQVFMVVRSHGGTAAGWTSMRLPLFISSLTSDDAVQLTFDPDIITFDSSYQNPRTRMPCGHGIGKRYTLTSIQHCMHQV